MAIVIDDAPFTISSTCSKTGEKYTGEFRAKKCLSLEDHLNNDRMFRDLLGGQNPAHAGTYASNIAAIVAELSVRLTKSPKWWGDVQGGLKFKDDLILGEIYQAALQVQKDAEKAAADKTEADKKELQKIADSKTASE